VAVEQTGAISLARRARGSAHGPSRPLCSSVQAATWMFEPVFRQPGGDPTIRKLQDRLKRGALCQMFFEIDLAPVASCLAAIHAAQIGGWSGDHGEFSSGVLRGARWQMQPSLGRSASPAAQHHQGGGDQAHAQPDRQRGGSRAGGRRPCFIAAESEHVPKADTARPIAKFWVIPYRAVLEARRFVRVGIDPRRKQRTGDQGRGGAPRSHQPIVEQSRPR